MFLRSRHPQLREHALRRCEPNLQLALGGCQRRVLLVSRQARVGERLLRGNQMPLQLGLRLVKGVDFPTRGLVKFGERFLLLREPALEPDFQRAETAPLLLRAAVRFRQRLPEFFLFG